MKLKSIVLYYYLCVAAIICLAAPRPGFNLRPNLILAGVQMLRFMRFSSASIVLCVCCRAGSEAGQGVDDRTFI